MIINLIPPPKPYVPLQAFDLFKVKELPGKLMLVLSDYVKGKHPGYRVVKFDQVTAQPPVISDFTTSQWSRNYTVEKFDKGNSARLISEWAQ